jgi:hypothetical protein
MGRCNGREWLLQRIKPAGLPLSPNPVGKRNLKAPGSSVPGAFSFDRTDTARVSYVAGRLPLVMQTILTDSFSARF